MIVHRHACRFSSSNLKPNDSTMIGITRRPRFLDIETSIFLGFPRTITTLCILAIYALCEVWL